MIHSSTLLTVLSAVIVLVLIPLTPSKAVSEEQYQSHKEEMLEDLKAEAKEASDEYGLDIDLTGAEQACSNPDTPITACRRAVRAAKKDIKTKSKSVETVVDISGGSKHVNIKGHSGKLNKELDEMGIGKKKK
jgi:hypothetical protein